MSKHITTSKPASLSGGVSDEESATTGNSRNDRARRRECPVPKPGGLVGQILGLRKDEDGNIPPVVKVEPIQRRGQDEKNDE
jgi:cytochrome c oxidase assembly factor 2